LQIDSPGPWQQRASKGSVALIWTLALRDKAPIDYRIHAPPKGTLSTPTWAMNDSTNKDRHVPPPWGDDMESAL